MKKFLVRLRDFEPAVLRSIYVAIVAVIGAAGITLTPAVDANLAAIVAAIVVIISIVQALLTRLAVFPPAVVEELEERTGEMPLAADELWARISKGQLLPQPGIVDGYPVPPDDQGETTIKGEDVYDQDEPAWSPTDEPVQPQDDDSDPEEDIPEELPELAVEPPDGEVPATEERWQGP